MLKYEKMLIDFSNIEVIETSYMPSFQSGLYYDGTIYIKDSMSVFHKHETLAEELAHHFITYGDITNLDDIQNRKYELKARRLASEHVITLDGIIDAFNYGISNLYEMSQYFEVTENFVLNTLKHYKSKYGQSVYHDNHLIVLDPLQVFEYKDMGE